MTDAVKRAARTSQTLHQRMEKGNVMIPVVVAGVSREVGEVPVAVEVHGGRMT